MADNIGRGPGQSSMARRKGGIVIYPRREVELDGKNPEIGLAMDLGDVPKRHSYLRSIYTWPRKKKRSAS